MCEEERYLDEDGEELLNPPKPETLADYIRERRERDPEPPEWVSI